MAYAIVVRPYRFLTGWWFPHPSSVIFAAVTDLASYPLWWNNILSVRQVDEEVAEVVCRAVLPYRLVVQLRRREQDEQAGQLRVEISGDLEGFLAGQLSTVANGTRLLITQEVVVCKKALRSLDFIARPLFRANHSAMMRLGHKGLADYLAKAE
jgi:hypothetical protein